MPIHQIDGSYNQSEKDNMEKLLAQELETETVKSELSNLSTYIQIELRDENWKYLLSNGNNETLKSKLNNTVTTQIDTLGSGKDATYNMAILQATLVNVCENCGIENMLTSYYFDIAGKGIDGHLGPNSLAAFAQVVKELKQQGYIASDYKFHGVLDDILFGVFSSILDHGPTDKAVEEADNPAEDEKAGDEETQEKAGDEETQEVVHTEEKDEDTDKPVEDEIILPIDPDIKEQEKEETLSDPEAKEKKAGEQGVESKDKDKEKEVVPTEGKVEDPKEEKGSESGKETTKATSEVAASSIDVPARVVELEEQYKMSLIGSQIKDFQEEFVTFFNDKVGTRNNDKKEQADFEKGFTSLYEQVMKQSNTKDAMQVLRTGLNQMLDSSRAITTSFDEHGNSIATGETLNRWGDNLGDIQNFFSANNIGKKVDALDARLNATDLVAMGLTDKPSFAELDKKMNDAKKKRDEDIKEINRIEVELATARQKVITLMEERTTKQAELTKIETQVSAEQEKINTPAANDKKLKSLETQQKELEDRLDELGDGSTLGLIFDAQEDVVLISENLAQAISDESSTRQSYINWTDDYALLLEREITTRSDTNKDIIDVELERNKTTRTSISENLKDKKVAIQDNIKAIQEALNTGDEAKVKLLQGQRSILLDEKTALENALEEVDFADRIAYKREYETLWTVLDTERQGLENEEDALEVAIDSQKNRLAKAIASWNVAFDTKAKADKSSISTIENAASENISQFAQQVVDSITTLYGGHAGISETISVSYAGNAETWKVASKVGTDGETVWSITQQGGVGKRIDVPNVPVEEISESSPSLYGQLVWNNLEQKDVKVAQAQLKTRQEWVDADMHVHVLQQRIDRADEKITTLNDLILGTEKTINTVNEDIAGDYKDNDEIYDYSSLVSAWQTLTDRYFTEDGTYKAEYYKDRKDAEEKLAIREGYQSKLEEYKPIYEGALDLQNDLATEKAGVKKTKTSYKQQLIGDPNYTQILDNLDTKKDTQEEDLGENLYWNKYATELNDPEGRTNEEPTSNELQKEEAEKLLDGDTGDDTELSPEDAENLLDDGGE